MTNIYIAIDPAWSYGFLSAISNHITLDFSTQSRLYEHAMDFIRLRHNFNWNHDAIAFNTGYNSIMMALQEYPIATSFFEGMYRQLFNNYHLALNSLGGEIAKITTITDSEGLITGIVCQVVETIPHIQSVFNPISQMGINSTC
ncbi:hypothetical protein AVT69_gp106 [Pseudomonas phage PhiPA3]|uniref:Uncharacterized protein 107 n=1 Tax=Pseudomonas phage PhiPA3 TaxID=998086 RepID=F8SJY3_BPPA3|nr:hypothetical protein AVT69_gp106 [Pseudomonas phage PhiPA3]AEH03531.1 hypothetical protein [Pseudomonas phage PhiPA3]